MLYTAERLSSFGYAIPTVCFCGHQLETLDHLFFSCPLADSLLSWLSSLLFLSSPSFRPILLCHVRFGFPEDELLCVPRFFVYALNVCKFSIWMARNDFSFRDVQPGAIAVLERIKSRLRLHLSLSFRHFKSSRLSGILLDSGVPMVLLTRSVMIVWFYRSSFYCFGLSSFFFSTLSLVLLFVCFMVVWLSALLPGPFVPSDSAQSV